MSVLGHLQPQDVLHYFEELCAIPHGSGNTKAISDYCVAFAKARGLKVRQDALNNVIIWKEAAAGYENAPGVIIQGHLDMVCAKALDCPVDMEKEGLRLRTDDQWIWAEGTSLGGDDGIAVAMGLALLADDSLPAPKLEVIFTVDEEVGMEGATGLDVWDVESRLMLNLDSEAEGVLTVSCAGGVRASCHIPVERGEANGVCRRIVIEGLTGGHSGVEIHKGRANSNMVMGRLLNAIDQEMPLRIAELSGGQADNAIAARTEAVILVPEEEAERAAAIVRSYEAVFQNEYAVADPGLKVTMSCAETSVLPLTLTATDRVLAALVLMPNGIQTMSMDIDGLVQTSLNLGILRLEDQELVTTAAVRSSVTSEKAMICNRLELLTQLLGGCTAYAGEYPGWEYLRNSPLRELTADVCEKQSGKPPVIEAIHAGMECGIFTGKLPGLDCVSIGPDMMDIHSEREKLSVGSVARVWALVKEVLRRTKEL